MQQQPSSEFEIPGLIIFGILVVCFLVLLVLALLQSRKERQRALKGRWMSWVEDPAQKGGDGDGGGDGGSG